MKMIMPSHSLKYDDSILEVGDLAVHDEEGYPETEGVSRVEPGYADASPVAAGSASSIVGGA
jgi:hypothetical protein